MLYQVLVKHPTEDRQVIITVGEEGYWELGYETYLPYTVPADVESSFVGASMFGWDKPIADKAHKWVAENPKWH